MPKNNNEPWFDMNKQSKIYRFFDVFLSDEQKDSLAVTACVNLLWLACRAPGIHKHVTREVFEGGKLVRCVTKRHICYIGFDGGKGTCNPVGKVEILYKPKKILGSWKELNLPPELSKLVSPTMGRVELRKAMNTIMSMKVFW